MVNVFEGVFPHHSDSLILVGRAIMIIFEGGGCDFSVPSPHTVYRVKYFFVILVINLANADSV